MAREYSVAGLVAVVLFASVLGFVSAQLSVTDFNEEIGASDTAVTPHGNGGGNGTGSPPPPATPVAADPPPPAPASGSVNTCGAGAAGNESSWSTRFDDVFHVFTTENSVRVEPNGDALKMQLDETCAAVFGSRTQYFTGRFSAKLQLPCGNSSGTVFAFYTTSDIEQDDHDEIDIEILGNETSKGYTLQTNMFCNGYGNREMRHDLKWFDPCEAPHEYYIQWNSAMVVVGVDDTPLRVFKNNKANGLPYFNKAQKLYVSYWDGSSWATQGGRIKIDFQLNGPFVAELSGFHNLQGCETSAERSLGACSEPSVDRCWDRPDQHYLTNYQKEKLANATEDYCTYNYCDDDQRFATTGKPGECYMDL